MFVVRYMIGADRMEVRDPFLGFESEDHVDHPQSWVVRLRVVVRRAVEANVGAVVNQLLLHVSSRAHGEICAPYVHVDRSVFIGPHVDIVQSFLNFSVLLTAKVGEAKVVAFINNVVGVGSGEEFRLRSLGCVPLGGYVIW